MTRPKNEPIESEKRPYAHVISTKHKVGASTEEISDHFRMVGWIGPWHKPSVLMRLLRINHDSS